MQNQVDEFLNWLTKNGSRIEYVSDGKTRTFLLGGQPFTPEEFRTRAEEWLAEQGASITASGTALIATVAMKRIARGPRIWPPSTA